MRFFSLVFAMVFSLLTQTQAFGAGVNTSAETLMRRALLSEINKVDSRTRAEIMSVLESDCDSTHCLVQHYGSGDIEEIKKSFNFSDADIVSIVPVGSYGEVSCATDACKNGAAPALGDDLYIAVVQLKAGYNSERGNSPVAVRINRTYQVLGNVFRNFTGEVSFTTLLPRPMD